MLFVFFIVLGLGGLLASSTILQALVMLKYKFISPSKVPIKLINKYDDL